MNMTILSGILLDEELELSLNELCLACATSAEWVIELVAEGILEPIDSDQIHWRFSGTSLKRAHTAMRLQQDLGINLAGVALALDLLDEIESLQARLNFYET